MIDAVESWMLLRSLRSGARRPVAELERSRDGLLRAAVEHAYKRIPLYRRLWNQTDLDPTTIASLDDLSRLPVLGAAEAREAAELGDLLDRKADVRAYPSYRTSASSGQSLAIPRGPVERRLWRVGALRIWFEHGYRWSDLTAHLDPQAGPPHPLQRLGVSRSVWITASGVGEQLDALREARADVLTGTPTVLRRLATKALTDRGAHLRPRIVFCQGEVLDDATRDLIGRGFRADPVDLYGATEVGYLAWQCELRGDLHINAELVAVEILRDSQPAEPGELGSVVVTDLRGRLTPRIRWDTGDLARAAAAPCACGRTLPTIGTPEGRAKEALSTPDGRRVTQRGIADALAELVAPQLYRLEPLAGGPLRLHLDSSARDRAEPVRRRLARLLNGHEAEIVIVPISSAGPKTPLRAAGPAAPS